MATDLILRIPERTLIEKALGHSEIPAIESAENVVSRQQILIISAVQTFLNVLAIALVGLSAGGFMTGNAEIGLWALGPALAGIVGVTGIQVRIFNRLYRRGTI